jgi:chitodextrinase
MAAKKIFKFATIISLILLGLLGQQKLVLGAVTPPTNGLVGYWNFDEGTGSTVNDSSGSNYTAIASNMSWDNGVEGNSGTFNGVSSMAALSATDVLDGLTTGTISAWVKWNGSSATSTIFDGESNGNYRLKLSIYQSSPTKIDFQVIGTSNGTPQLSAYASIPNVTGVWHNLVYESSSSGNMLYVDNVQASGASLSYTVGSPSTSFFFSNASSGTTHYVIGQEYNTALTTFSGDIDEMRVYNRLLSTTEISELYNYGQAQPSINSFSASPSSVTSGGSSTLSFATSGAGNVSINTQGGFSATGLATQSGSTIVNPTTTTSYTLSATNANGTVSAEVTVIVGGSSGPPSVPANLSVTSVSTSTVNLSWSASTDPASPSSSLNYLVYRNGQNITTTTDGTTIFTDLGLTSGTTYSYAVAAEDPAGNISAQSTAVSTTTLSTGSNPASIPAEYQSLYNGLLSGLNTSNQDISVWDHSTYPVNYAVPLINADGQQGVEVLNRMKQINSELTADQALGVKAVDVPIPTFPLFDQNYYTCTGSGCPDYTAAEASTTISNLIAFYQQVRTAIHAHGMKMMVESNMLFSSGNGNPFPPAAYYQNLTLSQFETRRSAGNIILAGQIQPDYFVLQSEPTTDAYNMAESGNTTIANDLDNPSIDTGMISQFVTDLDNANIPNLHTPSGTEIGSGFGAWQTSNWQQYLGTPGGGTGLLSISHLDKIDMHMFFFGPSDPSDEVATVIQAANDIHSAGKDATMSEVWPDKTAAEPITQIWVANPVDPTNDYVARQYYSFWEPLDEQYVLMLVELANYIHLDYMNQFMGLGTSEWASLADTNPPGLCQAYPSPNPTYNAQCDSSISTAEDALVSAAINSSPPQISPTGLAYQADIIQYSVSKSPPSVPTGITATPVSSSQIDVSWNASTDPNGYSASQLTYAIYRNTVQVGTVTGTTSFQDTGLSPNTAYSYTISAQDPGGNTSAQSSPPVSAYTEKVLPYISDLVGDPTATSTVISWSTNEPTNAQIFYGLTSSYGQESPLEDQSPMATFHSITLSGLTPATLYHFKAVSIDSLSNSTSTVDFTFTTLNLPLPPAPQIESFTASPNPITLGQSSQLTWIILNTPSYLSINQGVGSVLSLASASVSPGVSTSYTLTASNLGGTSTKSTLLSVGPAPTSTSPTITFSANPSSIAQGQSTVLSWTASGTEPIDLSIDNGIGDVTALTQATVVPSVTTTYTLTATNIAGTSTQQTMVTVSSPAPPGGGSPTVYGGSPTVYIPPAAIPSSTLPSVVSPLNSSTTPLILINDNGTFYLIINGFREGITDPGILYSYGLNFENATTPTESDLNLPQGQNLPPDNGALVKSSADPTVYLISNQQRYGFTSASVFTGLGFSFSNVLTVTSPELTELPIGPIISTPSSQHLPGLDINENGTIYWIGPDNELHGYPSLSVYNSWHILGNFLTVVPANTADLALPVGGVVPQRELN